MKLYGLKSTYELFNWLTRFSIMIVIKNGCHKNFWIFAFLIRIWKRLLPTNDFFFKFYILPTTFQTYFHFRLFNQQTKWSVRLETTTYGKKNSEMYCRWNRCYCPHKYPLLKGIHLKYNTRSTLSLKSVQIWTNLAIFSIVLILIIYILQPLLLLIMFHWSVYHLSIYTSGIVFC